MQGIVQAGDDKPIAVDQLPNGAKEFINTYFGSVTVSYAKVDKDWFETSYEVIFTDGSKVEFNKKGEWKEVDCKHTSVPAGIIPEQIQSYVTKNHAGQTIVQIDRDRKDYEVKLTNNLEIKFDKKFNIISYDD